mgnify:CR=1 FL=1
MGINNYLIEYAINTVANRKKFCTLADFKDVLNKNKGREIYRSMFLYDPNEITKHVEENNSVARYNGKQAIDKLYIDIDLEGQKQGDVTINKVGMLVNDILDLAGVKNVATLPTLDEARAKIVAILRSPAQKIASILLAPASKIAILALEKSKK